MAEQLDVPLDAQGNKKNPLGRGIDDFLRELLAGQEGGGPLGVLPPTRGSPASGFRKGIQDGPTGRTDAFGPSDQFNTPPIQTTQDLDDITRAREAAARIGAPTASELNPFDDILGSDANTLPVAPPSIGGEDAPISLEPDEPDPPSLEEELGLPPKSTFDNPLSGGRKKFLNNARAIGDSISKLLAGNSSSNSPQSVSIPISPPVPSAPSAPPPLPPEAPPLPPPPPLQRPVVDSTPQQTSFTSPLIPEGVTTVGDIGEGSGTSGIDSIIEILGLLEMSEAQRAGELNSRGLPDSIIQQVLTRVDEIIGSSSIGDNINL